MVSPCSFYSILSERNVTTLVYHNIEKCYVKDDSNREMLDIIAGKFFIAYAPIESEKFLSMPKELARKYEEKFKYPERFYKSLDGIEAKPYKPVSKDMER